MLLEKNTLILHELSQDSTFNWNSQMKKIPVVSRI